jgi:carbon starvation protein
VAALALLVVSCWLISKGKSVKFTLLPALFMLVTAIGALFFQLTKYVRSRDYVLVAVVLALTGLSAYMVYEIFPVITTRRIRHG